MRVLIAEDERDLADIVTFGVRMIWPDADVVVAASGAEALARFAEQLPDLVVLDIAMPPPDGFEVLRQIRERSRVPVMMLTVRNTEAEHARAVELGADYYLTKPFDHLELLARLKALASGNGGEAGSDRSVTPQEV